MTKKERIIGCVVGLVLLVSVGVFVTSFREAEVVSEKEVLEMFKESEPEFKNVQEGEKANVQKQEQEVITEKKNIVVEIKGEVKSPNVYTLNEGSRINELIEKAGGLTQEADIDNVNRASLVSDGQCIVIGNINNTEEEKAEIATMQGSNIQQNGSAGNTASKDGVVNINTATLDELQTLTGIGEGKASAIIEYRETSGGFKTIEDIKNISGIGEKTFEKIRDRLSV
ncbi:MAG: helix-hairpin-helix domain-containing protein [Sarcina sp.]